MNKITLPLSPKEELFKHDYLNVGKKFSRPMTWMEFESISNELSPETYQLYKNIECYHVPVSISKPGHTIMDVDDDYCNVVIHGRYSIPIMHNHSYIELVYVYSGCCTNFVEEQVIQMSAGDVCILAPDAMHGILTETDDSIVINLLISKKLFDHSFIHILKGGKAISGFVERILYNKQVSPYMIFHTGEDQYLIDMFTNLYYEKQKNDFLFHESVSLYIKQIFIRLIRYYEMMAIVSNPLDNAPENNIMALIGYISINYNTVTLSGLAKFFGYNENYLGKMIYHYTGKKFNDLIADFQMEKAKQLLENGSLSITEVASAVGCYDSSHFNRKFKKAFDCTPKEYRKQLMLEGDLLSPDNI